VLALLRQIQMEQSMKYDDDTDSGGGFFFDAVKTIIGAGFVALLVVTVGFVIREFVA